MTATDQTFLSLEEAVQRYNNLWEKANDPEVSRTFTQTHDTIRECMAAIMETPQADEPLIFFGDEVITRREADRQANKIANALTEVGVVKGRRVSIIMANRPEIVEVFIACYKTGFIAAPYNQRCTSPEIQGAIRTAGSSTVFIEYRQLEKIYAPIMEGDCPSVHRIVVLDWPKDREIPEDLPVPVYDFDTFVAEAPDTEPEFKANPNDGALLLSTGGTTGVSKGCVQTQSRMVFELQAMANWVQHMLTRPNPRVLICMPMTHIMGINYGINWQMINGGGTIIANGHRPEDIVDAFARYEPTMWGALPTLIHAISFDERLPETSYKDLDLVIFGGSFISTETLNNMLSKTRASFIESYGMTESFGFVTANPARSMGKVGSIGLPLSSTDVLIVDTEDKSRALEPGQYGEIAFRGPQVIDGYWNNPEETAKALVNGWMYSGDIGYMDEDGYFYITDRKKDIIVVSGFNVFPKEIDELLMSHPAIADACTIGVPNAHSGERPKSFIVLKPGYSLTPEEVIAFCKETLVAYKAPKFVEFVSEIPKTKNRKQDRALLRKREEERFPTPEMQEDAFQKEAKKS